MLLSKENTQAIELIPGMVFRYSEGMILKITTNFTEKFEKWTNKSKRSYAVTGLLVHFTQNINLFEMAIDEQRLALFENGNKSLDCGCI